MHPSPPLGKGGLPVQLSLHAEGGRLPPRLSARLSAADYNPGSKNARSYVMPVVTPCRYGVPPPPRPYIYIYIIYRFLILNLDS